MDSTFCIVCGHSESEHSAAGWTGTRCLAYPGGCDCIAFAPMPDPYVRLEDPFQMDDAWADEMERRDKKEMAEREAAGEWPFDGSG